MAAKLLTQFKQRIAELKLIPAGGGCFELTLDGDLIYSKLQTGTFPDEGSMAQAVADRLQQLAAR